MSQLIPSQSFPTASRGGGRISSDRYRLALSQADDFTGLEAGVDRYQLLLLVKRVGKAAGYTSRMIQLLDYYFAFTRQCDWEEGARPIVYQSLARTALDLGVSERQVQKLEAALFAAGAIGWNDSGNHKRYGQRDPQSGRLLYAYGIDLTPLAYLKPELEAKLAEKQLYDQAWLETKRQISWHRRQIRSLLLEWPQREEGARDLSHFERRYDEIAVQIRTHLRLEELRQLLARHASLHDELMAAMGVALPKMEEAAQSPTLEGETHNRSCRSEPAFAHYKSTTQEITSCSSTNDGFQKSVAESSEVTAQVSATGIEHVALSHVLQAASDRFRAELPLAHRPMNWDDVVAAAYHLRARLGVSQQSWGEACGTLGRNTAAICLLVTDRAALREVNPVLKPAAYFRAMVSRARGGELRLHASVFGLLERGEADAASAAVA
ncbi:plasmid replication protein RepC [Aeoliella sp. SH292]|uniref:plasmid replication protein RepC n=1 Tax=Aeoliella sp. SH292 TaxID=3454464 RepID=UPI003F9DA753